MQVRLATVDDISQLWMLVDEYLADQAAIGAPDGRAAMAVGVAHGIKTGEAIVVAEEDGELLGFVAWTHLPTADPDEVLGFGTYVKPEWRNCGISSEMRKLAKEHCKGKGYSFVTGAALLENPGGVHSAASSGAEVVGYLLRWGL